MLVVQFIFPDFEILQKENVEIQFLQGLLLEQVHIRSSDGQPGDYKDV